MRTSGIRKGTPFIQTLLPLTVLCLIVLSLTAGCGLGGQPPAAPTTAAAPAPAGGTTPAAPPPQTGGEATAPGADPAQPATGSPVTTPPPQTGTGTTGPGTTGPGTTGPGSTGPAAPPPAQQPPVQQPPAEQPPSQQPPAAVQPPAQPPAPPPPTGPGAMLGIELPAGVEGEPVPEAEVAALIRAARDRGFQLQMDGSTYGLRRNGDRYLVNTNGSIHFVQRGLRSWSAFRWGNGTMSWEGPFSSYLPQAPAMSYIQSHPEAWGIIHLLETGLRFRRVLLQDGEMWAADLPAGGQALPGIVWADDTMQVVRLILLVRKVDDASLPVYFYLERLQDGTVSPEEGIYEWVEPELPPIPPDQDPPEELGLAGYWLGQHRDQLEGYAWVPEERRPEPDGSEWTYWNQIGLKYDPTGQVVAISQARGRLINGLAIGDAATTVERYFGTPARTSGQWLEYDFPGGNRLRIRVEQGKVVEFQAVAPQ